jgi:hypothetical protein
MWCLLVLATLWALVVPTHCATAPAPAPVGADPPVAKSDAVAGATSRELKSSYGGTASYAGYAGYADAPSSSYGRNYD